ncbi:MAG: two-component system response regulator [candidate division NC10 bacterium CSP1-5]|nr:MAG: two-component system response regulator [candidate division NC10 bacterium CSP1-5]
MRAQEDVIRILIIHRSRLIREGFAFVLDHQESISVIGSVAGVGEVVGDLERLRPAVILLDLCLPDRGGLRDAQWIREVLPGAKILMTGLSELESDVLACFEAGAAGYLPQEASLEELLNSIQAVAAGEVLCSPKVTALLVSRIAEASRERELRRVQGLPNLTRRELEIIALVEEGLSNKEIAVRLEIEIPTVKTHIHNILEKLQLDGRREAAQYVREWGLLRSSP